MRILDFWPFCYGGRYLCIELAVEPNTIIQSGAMGIDLLLKRIGQYQPDVLIGDFGVKNNLQMSHEEYYFRELRKKYPDLAIVVCGTSVYSSRWADIASELRFVYKPMPKQLESGCLNNAIEEAVRLISNQKTPA